MAIELALQRRGPAAVPDIACSHEGVHSCREALNWERTWHHSYLSDKRSVFEVYYDLEEPDHSRLSIFRLGQPGGIVAREASIIPSAKDWYKQPGTQSWDLCVSAMVELHRVMVRSLHPLRLFRRPIADVNFRGGLSPRCAWTLSFAAGMPISTIFKDDEAL